MAMAWGIPNFVGTTLQKNNVGDENGKIMLVMRVVMGSH